jgi:hypothetical protein
MRALSAHYSFVRAVYGAHHCGLATGYPPYLPRDVPAFSSLSLKPQAPTGSSAVGAVHELHQSANKLCQLSGTRMIEYTTDIHIPLYSWMDSVRFGAASSTRRVKIAIFSTCTAAAARKS